MSDHIARNVFVALVKDFRLYHGKGFAEGALQALNASPQEFRDYKFPTLGEVPVQRFKAYWQLQNLFKRYRFTHDRFTDDELKSLSYEKYVKFQEEKSVYSSYRTSTTLVLSEARKICRQILCLPFEPVNYTRNGKRAARGVPLKNAYLDGKWGDPEMFSCPTALQKDLLQESSQDSQLRPIYKRLLQKSKIAGKRLDLCADRLNLTLVPKSWKTHRAITPLSTYGLYWSFGIGGYVEACLRMSGLDISRLQATHQRLAKRYSEKPTHVTADLSSASDNLRSDILNRVLPRFFYTALKKTFVRTVTIEGTDYHTVSVLPMGNGATFPVETLIFYCLIKAIGNLLKVKGVYSVYGDDLIYPVRIHSYVSGVFRDLGIGVNGDKTFVKSHFRESCGGDYYHKIDVRPALFSSERMPPSGRLKQVQWLYKQLNALLKRWDEAEIPQTVRYLLSEIAYLHGKVFLVPKSFPSSSGFQVEDPFTKRTTIDPFVYPKRIWRDGSTWIHFKFIGESSPSTRRVVYEDIYRWDAMRPKEIVFVPPPVNEKTWARYTNCSNTKQLAKWYLKSLLLKNGEASPKGAAYRDEPLHESGSTKVNVSMISYWT